MLKVPPSTIALFSVFLYGCYNAIFAYLTNIKEVSILQLLAVQKVVSFTLCAGYIGITGTPHGLYGPPESRRAIWAIAVLAILGSLLVMGSLQQLTLSEHTTVMCILPFVTAFMAWLWLGERFTSTQAVCCLTCMAGVMLITDPFRIREPGASLPDDGRGSGDAIPDTIPLKLLGIGLTLLGIGITAPQCKSPLSHSDPQRLLIMVVLVRKIGETATIAQMNVVCSFTMIVALPILMAITRSPLVIPSEFSQGVLLISLVVIGMSADLLVVYAGQITSPTTVTICAYAGVIFSSILQWSLYGNHPSMTSAIGMSVVVVAELYGVISGPGEERPDQDPESRPLLQDNSEVATDQ